MRRLKQRGLAVLKWGSDEDILGTNKIKSKDKHESSVVLNAQMWLLVYQNRLYFTKRSIRKAAIRIGTVFIVTICLN